MELIWVVPLFFALVVAQRASASAKKTETIISAGNWVSVDPVGSSGTSYNKWVFDSLKNSIILFTFSYFSYNRQSPVAVLGPFK